MKRSKFVGGLMSAVVLVSAVTVRAGTAVLTLDNGDGGGSPFNTTRFTVTNTSGPAVELTGMKLTVGDSVNWAYDEIYSNIESFSGGSSPTATLLVGSRDQDNANYTLYFEYAFTGFTPSTVFTGQWDIDPLPPGTGTDANARMVLFNNGSAPNAVLTLTFSDGVLTYEFPDLPEQSSYSISVVPEPAALGLLAPVGVLLGRRR